MRVADYIADFFVQRGMQDVFMITGGGAMFINDAIGRQPLLRYWTNHHEQASAMAAESYARLNGKMAPLCVTSGPGGTNAITGVWGAWVDSIPMLVISGQVRQNNTVQFTNLPLRQYGDQEFNIVECVRTFTKIDVQINDPSRIRYELERAYHLALEGRPGPVWLDIPLDVQSADVDPVELEGYASNTCFEGTDEVSSDYEQKLTTLIHRLSEAVRPVLLLGPAVRSAGVRSEIMQLVEKMQIPVVTAWNAHDLIAFEEPLYIGRQGHPGDRAANFAVQNADFLLILGSRMGVRQVGLAWESFSRESYRVMVDIDENELHKPNFCVDLPICSNLRDFVYCFKHKIEGTSIIWQDTTNWVAWCQERKRKYPVVQKEYYRKADQINPYCFIDELWKLLPNDAIIVSGNGTACTCSFQAAKIREGQRLYTNVGCAAMGYDLPAAIGAAIASGKPVICLAGDGSLQMNIQELQTVVQYHLPIKLFVLNNAGYHSIRQTQANFFNGKFVGCDRDTGVSFPDMEKISYAYGINYFRCEGQFQMPATLTAVLSSSGAAICEVILDIIQPFAPRTSSGKRKDGSLYSRPLEDLAPLLERDELRSNMLIPILEFE